MIDPTLIDAAGTVTAAAAVYVAGQARRISKRLEDHDTLLYGTEKDDGIDGIASAAVDADRRSTANLKRIRHADGIDLNYDPEVSTAAATAE